MMVTVIGRGHSGTRAISHTLSASGVYMGEPLNKSGDLLPPGPMYDACRVFARYVTYEGGLKWDFNRVLSAEPVAEFTDLINEYLKTVHGSGAGHKGWKIPETVLCYPWIIKMFPDIKYIHWIRDPRDCILNSHVTDDLHDFGIEYPDYQGDVRLMRAYSWKYQRELMNATPDPANVIKIRFEDMVLNQDDTLNRLGLFLGLEMRKIEMRPESVGRWKTDAGIYMYDFLKPDMDEHGYV